jgi:hypothetical protein
MMLLISSCEENNQSQDPTIQDVIIQPSNTSFNVGEQHEFSAFLLTESGDTVEVDNADIELDWWSSDTTVFTVEANGTATGNNPGDAYCIAEVRVDEDANLKRIFTGRDSAFVSISGF